MTYGNYPDLGKVKKILVIRMRHLGDVLLTSPVFANLKKAMPEASIDVLINKESLQMLEGDPAISEYILYDRKKESFLKKLKTEAALYKKIGQGKYDLVLNLTEGDRGALGAFFSRARYKVGFDPEGKGFKFKNRIYTHLVKNCKTPRHTVERQLDVIRRIGIFPNLEERELRFIIPQNAINKVVAQLEERGLKEGSFIVIHPASRWRFKCLPTDKMAALIQELHSLGHQVVLTAGPDPKELAMVEEIISKTSGTPVHNLAGKLSLKELGALFSMSRALISVDTVAPHIASALKVPLVVIFGPSSEVNWGPWMHPKSRVVTKNLSCRPCNLDGCGGSKVSDCLATLSVNTILDALKTIF